MTSEKTGLQAVAAGVKSEEMVRTPQQAREMMKEVSWLCKVFSGQYDVKVLALPGEGVWTCGIEHKHAEVVNRYMRGEIQSLDDLPPEALKPKLITVRENDFYRDPPGEIRRKTRHESAHAAHSDFKLLFEGARKAQDEGCLPSTYMSAKNGPEDGWVNAMAAGESEAALEDLREGYTAKLAEILPHIPKEPLSSQFGKNAIHYWLTGKDVPGLDSRVTATTDRLRGALDRFFASRSAGENTQIFDSEIWPVIRELEKEEMKDEQMRQAANEAMNQSGNQGEGQQGQQSESGGQSQGGNLGEQIKNELEQGQKGDQQGESQPSGEPKPEESQQAGSGEEPIDLTKLSAGAREKLRKMIENMSPEEREQLEQAAKQEVDKRQSEGLNKEAPKVIQMEKDEKTGEYRPKIQEADQKEVAKAETKLENFRKEETAREEAEMAENQRLEGERQKQIEENRARQKKLDDMKKEGFEEGEEEDYDTYKQLEREIEAEYRGLRQEMQRMFPRKPEVQKEGFYYSGQPNAHRAAREFPVGSERFYEKKSIELSQEVNLAVWMALDISGTMAGVKIRESLKNIIMWSKLGEEFSIPMGIVLFGNDAELLKDPNHPFSAPKEKIKAGLIKKAINPNQGTNLGAAVEMITTELTNSRRKFPGMHGVALFVTDGQPTSGLMGQELIEEIDKMKGSFTCFAFGLGEGSGEQSSMQQMLTSYFGEGATVVPKTFGELPKETAKVMNPIMKRLASQLRI